MKRTSVVAAFALLAAVVGAGWAQEAKVIRLDPPVRLKAGQEFIDTGEHVGHAGPLLADLDADGKPDLLVGNFRGHFQVYKNVGNPAEPTFVDQGLLKVGAETVRIHNW